MDINRNEMIFKILQKECEWRESIEIGGNDCNICNAGQIECEQDTCMPFKFTLYFQRPEIRQ